jgi:tRNA(Arg) A34 adenosine deaminase TadA
MSEACDPMSVAFHQARYAAEQGEVPVGAVLVRGGIILASAGNEMRQLRNPTAHAEMLAIQRACEALETDRLLECDLYVTLEPCTMCAGAIALARIRRVYFGALDPKNGAVDSGVRFFNSPTCHHKPEIYGDIRGQESSDLLQSFFQDRR